MERWGILDILMIPIHMKFKINPKSYFLKKSNIKKLLFKKSNIKKLLFKKK